MRYVILIAAIVLSLAACKNDMGSVGQSCDSPGSTQVRAADHSTWTCEYPDNDPHHLHWVRTG